MRTNTQLRSRAVNNKIMDDADKILTGLAGTNGYLHTSGNHKRQVSDDGLEFHKFKKKDGVVAVSKTFNNEEILIVKNTSSSDAIEECITIDPFINRNAKWMNALYGYVAGSRVQVIKSHKKGEDIYFVKLFLLPGQLVILKNIPAV